MKWRCVPRWSGTTWVVRRFRLCLATAVGPRMMMSIHPSGSRPSITGTAVGHRPHNARAAPRDARGRKERPLSPVGSVVSMLRAISETDLDVYAATTARRGEQRAKVSALDHDGECNRAAIARVGSAMPSFPSRDPLPGWRRLLAGWRGNRDRPGWGIERGGLGFGIRQPDALTGPAWTCRRGHLVGHGRCPCFWA